MSLRVHFGKLSASLRVFVVNLLCFTILLHAATFDTTLTGNGGPGPYPLGNAYVDSAAIAVTFADSAQLRALPFTYVGSVNGLLFSAAIDSGATFRVRAPVLFPGLSKVHALYEKAYLLPGDTSARPIDSTGRGTSPGAPPDEDLQVSGYKSVSVSVGSLGQTNLEQALDVTITGRIADSTELRGHLSDQGSSLEGATREISEIDMIYLTLVNPRYTATVGDQYLRWPAGGMLYGEKKVKGVSAGLTLRKFAVSGFGALSGGSFAAQTFRGQAGLQGPYFLTGNGEAPNISLLGGTVSVWVNGAKVKEGEEADYQVDYDFGSITFSPRQPINDGDIIRAEYEYKVFDYQRAMFGGEVRASTRDSIATLRGAVWYEGDNADHPIDLGEITQEDRDSLAAAGDRPYLKSMMAYPIDPNDADSVAAYTGVYVKDRDSLGRERFVWTADVRTDRQLYRVPFRQVEPGTGDYADSTVCPSGASGLCYPVYRFVGTGGAYSASAPLPAPQRTVNGEALVTVRPVSWASLSVDVAGQDVDRNILSTRGDTDNRGAAAKSAVTLGRQRTDAPALWLRGSHQFISQRFGADIFTASQRRSAWNDTALGQSGAAQNIWEAAAGATVAPRITTEFSYGQRWRDSLITDRVGNTTSATLRNLFTASYDGAIFRHFDAGEGARSRRDNLRLSLDFTRLGAWIGTGDEWWWAGDAGRGHARGEAGATWKPLQARESILYVSERAGHDDLASPDTGSSLVWQQAFDHAVVRGWNLRGSSAYNLRHVKRPSQRISSMLVDAASDVTAGATGFTTQQRYTMNSERASRFIQQPKYVGPGLGTHVMDTALGGDRYVPKVGGDWIITEREVTDSAGGARVRKTGVEIDWGFAPSRTRPIKGILGDLTWRGSGRVTEHVRSDGDAPWTSWVPGYLSLSGEDPDSLVDYSELYYRQTVDWRPRAAEGLHAGLSAKPFLRTVRSYRETGAEWGGSADKKWERWFLGAEAKILGLSHEPQSAYAEEYRIDDRSVEVTEKRFLPLDIEVYLAEAGGWSSKDPSPGPDAGWYYSLRPGVAWTPARKGRAEASYSFSRVGLRDLDYRMARGLPGGYSHIIDVMADIAVGDHFILNASYRGEMSRPIDAEEYNPGIHVVSVGVKAFL